MWQRITRGPRNVKNKIRTLWIEHFFCVKDVLKLCIMLLEHGLRSEKMCTLQFSVDGEFITDLSREWFYVEGKDTISVWICWNLL